MRKLFILAFTTAALSGLASAASLVVNCGNGDIDNGNGSVQLTCPQFNGALGTYQSVRINTLSSVTQILDNTGAALFGSVTMTYSSPTFAGSPANVVVATTPVGLNNQFVANMLGTSVSAGNGGSFLVTVGSASLVGSVGQASGSAIAIYTYEPPRGVPEPTTLSLVGAALLGLGVIGKRRK